MTEDRTDVLGRRIGAALVDLLLMTVLFVVLGVLIGETSSGEGSASVNLGPFEAMVFFALSFAYYGVLEGTTGQTLGKRLLGVRVVRAADGGPPGGGAITARTLLRIVDALPLAYLLGLVLVLATGRRRQRLGDLAGGTTVARA